MALAARLDRREHHVFCILGDGEINEGQNWEAALFAAHHGLDRLVAICDCNRLQIDGFTADILRLEPLADKWRSFGWEVFATDGHNVDDIQRTLQAARAVRGQPTMVIARTIKGKGNRAIENRPESHNIKVPDRDAYRHFMAALDQEDFVLPY
jgi:transketolase